MHVGGFYLEWVSLNVADFAIGIALKHLRQVKVFILISPNLPWFCSAMRSIKGSKNTFISLKSTGLACTTLIWWGAGEEVLSQQLLFRLESLSQ